MSVKPLDLSMLDDAFDAVEPGKSGGTPLMLDIDLIHEDPDQPRKAFDDILELANSIAEVGVKVPISVRPHPSVPGHYMVKFGARRRRASISAGKTQIPAWIDAVPDDFEQVIENLQRKDLTPMELAIFMHDKQMAGMKVTKIAQKLGIAHSKVSKHLALIDLPPEIDAIYQGGRSTSPETIFELRNLFARFPEETKAWLASDVEVSRRSVDNLKNALGRGNTDREQAAVQTRAPNVSRAADPAEIKRPVVAVRVGDRYGFLVLTRRANEDDQVLVKWDDSGEVDAIACRDIVFLRLDDARRYEPLHRGLTASGPETPSPSAKP
jgi:ParB/RepB/Spo0J family partition protein